MSLTLIAMRKPDTCIQCQVDIQPRMVAWYDETRRLVTCKRCRPVDAADPRQTHAHLPSGR